MAYKQVIKRQLQFHALKISHFLYFCSSLPDQSSQSQGESTTQGGEARDWGLGARGANTDRQTLQIKHINRTYLPITSLQ